MTTNYFICTLGHASVLGQKLDYININQFIDIQAERVPDLPAVGFIQPSGDDLKPWSHSISDFRDIQTGSQTVADLLRGLMPPDIPSGRTVALLCASTVKFLFTWLALIRMGYPVLLVAPQCSSSAVAHLCKACEVSLLFYDEIYEDLARKSAGPVGYETEIELMLKAIPSLKDSLTSVTSQNRSQKVSSRIHSDGSLPFVACQSDAAVKKLEMDPMSVAYLHHTSGTSTGVPKPIPQSHRAAIGVLPQLDGSRQATFTTTPLYHGGIADVFRAWTSDALIWLFPGKKVPITGSNVVHCLNVTEACAKKGKTPQVKYFSSVPYVLQMLAADKEGLEKLQDMDIVGVGGAALPAEVGDELVRNGVNLVSRFGSAECGFIMSSHRDYEKDQDWQFLRSERGSTHLSFDSREDGLSELIVLPGWPHMAKTNRENGSYATADLFAPHPNVPQAWKYHSRADSQLTLITGKKFDPAPLESAIATASLLDSVLIFGNGKPYPGALLFRSSKAQGLPDKEVITAIAPIVEKLNADNQSHARIPRNMLIPMPFREGALEKSSKGTIVRTKAEERYSKTIDDAYFSTTITEGPKVPDQQVPKVILQIVESVVGKEEGLTEQTDLFSYGVDSVACVQIRYSVMQLLPLIRRGIPLTIVEDCVTIQKLSQFVVRRRNGQGQDPNDNESEYQLMLDLVEEYSKFEGIVSLDDGVSSEDAHCTRNGAVVSKPDLDNEFEPKKEVVVLTGATGALGAHMLDLYRHSTKVSKIYCLIRGTDDHAAFERVSKALEQRKLRPLHVSPGKETSSTKVKIIRARLSEQHLGLSTELYNQIANEATIIMHVAWAVNFRLSLRSFIRDHISGLRNLINLALRSPRTIPPRFAFCSSVASVSNLDPRETIPERVIDDPSYASPLGYSRSKWVAEQICQRAHEQTRLRSQIAVFRVGQLSGASQTGIWNEKEAWPMMLSSVKVTACLPDLKDEPVTWLPVDVAARALVETLQTMGLRDAGVAVMDMGVYHIINDDRTVTWAHLLGWLGKMEGFEIVEPSAWIERLEKLDEQARRHPALKLLGHWRNAYGEKSIGAKDAGELSRPRAKGSDHAEDQVEQMPPPSSLANEGITHELTAEQSMASSGTQGDGMHEQGEEHSTASPPNRYAMVKTKEAAPVMRSVMPVDELYFQNIWYWIKENV